MRNLLFLHNLLLTHNYIKKIVGGKIKKKKNGWNFETKICTPGMLPFQRSREKNHFNFFWFRCAAQNKALDMIDLVSIFCFFHQRIYGVNFKRIDNGLNSTTVSTLAASEIFKKSENVWCKSIFAAIHNILEKKNSSYSLVETAWNICIMNNFFSLFFDIAIQDFYTIEKYMY